MPYNNFKFEILNFKLKSGGFSLLELLVSVTIIALVTAVAVPNLRMLSKDQEINNAAFQLINTLRRAQSSASSRIKCPENQAADNWSVVMAAATYTLKSQCTVSIPPGNNNIVYSSAYAATPTSSTTFQQSNSICLAGEVLTIYFTKQQVAYQCAAGAVTPIPAANITITLSNSTGASKQVVIETGGSIR